jgi:hypothetical protein
MDLTKNAYEEWFYLNGNVVSEKKFMNSFDRNTLNYKTSTQFKLAKRILSGENVKIKQNVYHYEERNVVTGEIKEQKY